MTELGGQSFRSFFPKTKSGWINAIFNAAVLAAFGWLLTFTAVTLFAPLLDAFGFRQTQTAISVRSILQDQVFLNYFTPVLGAPWSIPFEAPIYHAFVALFSYVTGIDLDASGRVVSVTFFVATLWCGYGIVALLSPGERYTAKLFVLLGLVSPLYLFWSRTFMVESCALFFATAWLMCVIRGTIQRSLPLLILSIPLCVLAALAKFTTWPAFVVAYGLFVLADFYRNRTLPLQPLLLGGTSVVLAFILALAWTRYSDQVKLLNPFGSYLVSASLHRWVFGTWSQLFSEKLWFDALPKRMLPDAIGYGWPALLVCILYARMASLRTIAGFACILLFLLPIATFTNLQIIHDYYLSANAIFLVAAASFLVSEVAHRGKPIIAMVITFLLLSGAIARFASHQWVWATNPLPGHPAYVAGKLVAKTTPPDSSLIVFGFDWSSEVHYYAERRGIALPGWAAPEKVKRVLDDPDSVMGGLKLGAVVDCRSVVRRYPGPVDNLVTNFVTGWSKRSTLLAGTDRPGSCSIYLPS